MAFISRVVLKNKVKISNCRCLQPMVKWYSSAEKDKDEAIDLDKPIKYSTSKAATWDADHSFSGTSKENVAPWYQPIVISISLAVFMVYFFILREENDVDEKLSMSLYDHVDGMEEVQVRNAIKYYKENDTSYDTSNLEKRLSELIEIKNKR